MASRERGNPEVKRTFERLGGVAKKKSDLGNSLRNLKRLQHEEDSDDHTAGGYPDYTVLLPPFGFYIEAKAGHNNRFDFSDISEKQRNYLDSYPDISYLWLWMGEGQVNSDDNPRSAWLIPWPEWLEIERMMVEDRVSLPYEARSGADAVTLLARYQLTWIGKQRWDIPPTNPLWTNLNKQAKEFATKCELWSTAAVPHE